MRGKISIWCILSLIEKYKCAKVKEMIVTYELWDPVIAQVAPNFATWRKWTPFDANKLEKAALLHKDTVGHVQQWRGGFGLEVSKSSRAMLP